MRLEEVPQDEHLFGEFRELVYARDKDGTLRPVKSAGWEVKSLANSQYWDELHQHSMDALESVRARKTSPLFFFMTLHQMDVAMLAQYSSQTKWSVKKHLNPKHFNRLSPAKLTRYAAIFKVTPEELKNYDIDSSAAKHTAVWASKYNQNTPNGV